MKNGEIGGNGELTAQCPDRVIRGRKSCSAARPDDEEDEAMFNAASRDGTRKLVVDQRIQATK